MRMSPAEQWFCEFTHAFDRRYYVMVTANKMRPQPRESEQIAWL